MKGKMNMQLKEVALFYEKVKTDHELRDKFTKIISDEEKVFTKEIVQFGKQNDFEFNEEDVIQYVSDTNFGSDTEGELSDRQLESVSGGSVIGTVFFLAGVSLLGATIATGVTAHIIGSNINK